MKWRADEDVEPTDEELKEAARWLTAHPECAAEVQRKMREVFMRSAPILDAYRRAKGGKP